MIGFPSKVASRGTQQVNVEDLFGNGMFSEFFSSIFGGGGSFRSQRSGMPRSRQQIPKQYQQQVTISLQEAFSGTTRQFQSGDRLKEVSIPAGARTGTKVRVSGAGPAGPDGKPSDLILLVDVTSDPNFNRKGNDLHTQAKISAITAMLGGEIRVKTLSGQVVLTIPPGTQPEQLIRIAGRGMPHLKNPETKGDLIVRIKVQIPRDLTSKQMKLLEEIDNLTKK